MPSRSTVLPAFQLRKMRTHSSRFSGDAAGAVAAADAELHPALGSEIERGEEAGGDGDVADRRVGDAGAEAHIFRVGGHEGQERKWLLPDDVGIENPTEGKASGFG